MTLGCKRLETFTVASGKKGEKIDTENWFKFPSINDNNNNNNNNNNDKNYQTLLGWEYSNLWNLTAIRITANTITPTRTKKYQNRKIEKKNRPGWKYKQEATMHA